MQAWGNIELAGADLGDARRERRRRTLVNQLRRNPPGTSNHACPTAAHQQAAYRCFDNDQVEPQRVLASHSDSAWRRRAACRRVLVVQDTTSGHQHRARPVGAARGSEADAHARRIR